MFTIFAGFNFSTGDYILISAAILLWIGFCISVAIVSLEFVLRVISRFTGKDLSLVKLFSNPRFKRIAIRGCLAILTVLLLMLAYYGLIDN